MKQTLALLKKGFESSSFKTPEFLAFARTFKKELSAILKAKGCTNLVFSNGHFYISGFLTAPSGQIYYFSLSDVRGMEYVETPILMYRTAASYSDYTGGSNQWVNICDIADRMRVA